MIKIENGYIILEFDQEYNEMPPGFDLDLDYFMTTAIENRRPIEGKNLPAYLKKLNKAKDEFKDKEAFVKKLDFEIGVVSTFLPAMLTEDEIRAIIVNANLVEVSMRTVMPLLKGKSFDSKLVQKIISPI